MLRMPFPLSRKKPRPVENLEVRGELVTLREKRIEDTPNDYAWRVDPELARLDATRPLNMAYEDFLRYSQEEIDYPSTRSRRFGIDDLRGKHIGNCMYYDIDNRRGEAELGIMIGDRDYWSKGYGTDAVNLMLTHIFSETQLRRVYLHTLDWNLRAQRSFAKSGFKEVKSVRRRGLEFIRMEILRPEWEWRRNHPTDGPHN